MSQPTGQPAQPSAPTTTPAQPAPAPGAPTTGQATPPAAPPQPTQPPAAQPPAQPTLPAPGAPQQPGQPPQGVYVPPGYMLVPAQGQAHAPTGPQYVPVAPLPQAPPAGQDPDRDVSKLPAWAQSMISDLRQENAQRRISERTAVVTQHGLAAAQQLGVNPAALLSSVPWAEAAKQLDPHAADFPQQLTATIQRIVQSSPWMQATPQAPAPQGPPSPPPPPTSGGDFAAGNGAGLPITREQLANMSSEEITEAFKAGKLRHLLT